MRRSPALVAIALVLAPSAALAATLEVGPNKPYAKPCQAIAAAQPGDVIEVDAAGDYTGDTCAWSTDGLTVRGVNGRAKIDLGGAAPAQKKGIFTVYAPTATIENLELSGAAISANDGNNGAGIRHQGLVLTVRDCYLHDNQDGILGGPLANGQPADGQGEVLIERTELAKNGAGDGQSHNVYLNHYAKVTMRASWSHGANAGHLLKSRALETHVEYSRLSDDESSNVSYELSLPDGGKGFLIGNVIEQNADPGGQENGAIIDFASESAQAGSALFVVSNTVLNLRQQGATFVKVGGAVATPAVLRDNAFVGNGTITNQGLATLDHNFVGPEAGLVDAAHVDFHLVPGSPCVDAGVDPGVGEGQSLAPTHQYVHPAAMETRASVGTIDIGAYELGGGGVGGAGGAGGAGGGATTGAGGAGGSAATGAGGGATTGGGGGAATGAGGATAGTTTTAAPAATDAASGASGDSGGCATRTGSRGGRGAIAIAIAAIALGAARRRRSPRA
jgi:hypothetical protein